MAVDPIHWHEECLRNMIKAYEEKEQELHRLMARNARDWQRIEKYERQIERAKRTNKTSFDSERFKDS